MQRKDPNCPNCGGRSFGAVDPGDYYECDICERWTVESRLRYAQRSAACLVALVRWLSERAT